MELKRAAVTILVGDDGATIELHDKVSTLTLARIKLTPEQFCQAVGRLSHTPCEAEVWNMDKVNKRHEHKSFMFELPEGLSWSNRKEFAKKLAVELCPDGWEPDLYFESRGSFFTKDGREWASTTIRRWVDE